MAVFIGTATAADKAAWSEQDPSMRAEIEAKGMTAWGAWMAENADKIVDPGAPLGKTLRAFPDGISSMAICQIPVWRDYWARENEIYTETFMQEMNSIFEEIESEPRSVPKSFVHPREART
jgi:hypothetical protein